MYDHSLRHGRKHFCHYCLQTFITEEILKRHIKDCFIINGKVVVNYGCKLIWVDDKFSFQFPSSSLDNLLKKLSKDDCKYLSQEFYNNILALVKQKGFYPYEYMSDFEKFKEQLPSKENFYSSLTVKKISDKEHKHVFNAWNKFVKQIWNENDERLSRFVFKM